MHRSPMILFFPCHPMGSVISIGVQPSMHRITEQNMTWKDVQVAGMSTKRSPGEVTDWYLGFLDPFQ